MMMMMKVSLMRWLQEFSHCERCLWCGFIVASISEELFQNSFHQGGEFGSLGATANPEKKKPKHEKGKRKQVGKDVLFVFAWSKDSNLGKVGQEYGVRVIRLYKEDIDLADPQSIEQLVSQVSALKGCFIHSSIECKPWSQWPMAALESSKASSLDGANSWRTGRQRCNSWTVHYGS